MKFFIILTIFAAPADVPANTPLTLEPITTIEFQNTTQANTLASCVRVQKALTASKVTSYCSEVQPVSAE